MSKPHKPKSPTLPLRAPNLQVPQELAEPLEKFCAAHPGVTKADVVRAGLARFLPELLAGRMVIANGKLVSREELQPA